MPKKKSKRPRRPKIKRPHTGDKLKRAKRRYRKPRHPRSKINHSARIRQDREDVEGLQYLLHQLLKTASSTEAKPYNYHPRHYSKDPEYAHSSARMQEFKRAQPAPDVHFWNPQGTHMPTHIGNFPRARAQRRPAGWALGPQGLLVPRWQHPHVGV